MELAGVEVPIVWRGRRAQAFVPTLLADRDLELDRETIIVIARAQAAAEQGAETMPDDYAALARLLLRAEGVASSFIEGVTAPVIDIVIANLIFGLEDSPEVQLSDLIADYNYPDPRDERVRREFNLVGEVRG